MIVPATAFVHRRTLACRLRYAFGILHARSCLLLNETQRTASYSNYDAISYQRAASFVPVSQDLIVRLSSRERVYLINASV